MRLDRLLQSQGFGTRSECRALITGGRVCINTGNCRDYSEELNVDGLKFCVDGVEWHYRQHAYLVMNKPSGFECSHKPAHYPSIYSLLPPVLLRRGVQAVGRLDADTTGLLLLSDDGNFIHTCTSPKKGIGKCYEVFTRHPVSEAQLSALRYGVVLRDDPVPVRATQCELIDACVVKLTVTEGKYHLVKRLLAAVGNRVERLNRVSVGQFALPEALAVGSWQWLEEADLRKLCP